MVDEIYNPQVNVYHLARLKTPKRIWLRKSAIMGTQGQFDIQHGLKKIIALNSCADACVDIVDEHI